MIRITAAVCILFYYIKILSYNILHIIKTNSLFITFYDAKPYVTAMMSTTIFFTYITNYESVIRSYIGN